MSMPNAQTANGTGATASAMVRATAAGLNRAYPLNAHTHNILCGEWAYDSGAPLQIVPVGVKRIGTV